MKNKFVLFQFIGIILIAVSCSTADSKKTDVKEKPTLPITKLFTQSTFIEKEFVGELDAIQNVELRARVSGYIEKIFIDEGKEVKKGQLIFQLSDDEFQADLVKANANLKTAEAESKTAEVELKRIRILVEKNVVSPTELEMAKANFDAVKAGIDRAKSALENAKTQLSYTKIKAPFDGTINRIPSKIGSFVNEGILLTTVSDTRYVNVYFNVSESEYLEFIKDKKQVPFEKMNKVKLILADGSEYEPVGTIETMEGQFEENTGTIAFRARFANPDKILKHNSSGTVILTHHIEDALILPQKASFEIQDKYYVFLVGKDNIVKRKSFVPHSRMDNSYIVKSGLQEGDRIVYEGLQRVQDNMTINPKEVVVDSLDNVTSMLLE